MSPEPEDVGPGFENIRPMLDDVTLQLGKTIGETANKLQKAENRTPKIRMEGLILEPTSGTVHPVIQKDGLHYALGGANLQSLYPIEVSADDTWTVHWEGNAGDRTYAHINTDRDKLTVIKADDNKLGIGMEPSTPPDGEKNVLIGNVIFFRETSGKNSHKEEAEIIVESMLTSNRGHQVELLTNLTEGLKKAGMTGSKGKVDDPSMVSTIVS